MSLSPHQRAIEKAVRAEAPDLLKGLPGEKKERLIRFLETRIEPDSGSHVIEHQTMQVTSSPVPPAELLIGYNTAIPDGANRLFTLVEGQSTHRQALENKVVTEQLAESRRGQTLAFALALIFGVMAFVLEGV